MRLHCVWTILRKELLEALRDRRTLFVALVLPILLYPALFMLMTRLQESQEAGQKAASSRVAVWGELTPELKQHLLSSGKVELVEWAGVPASVKERLIGGAIEPPLREPPEDPDEPNNAKKKKPPETDWAKAAQSVLVARQADAVLIPWPGFAGALDGGKVARASVLYDEIRAESRKAKTRIERLLNSYRDEVLKRRESAGKLPGGFTEAILVLPRDVAGESRTAGMLLGLLLPYLLVILGATSGFYAAVDMTAGEKERGTMQTLLCAPVSSVEIIAGKFLAVWAISTLSTVMNLGSLALTFSSIRMIPGVELKVNPVAALLAFLLLMPVTMTISALFVAVGAFAKDFKEGQAYLTPIFMLLLFPLIVTTLPGIELNAYLSFVPISNSALLVRAVFLGDWHGDMLFLTMLSSLGYAALTLVFAARVYERNTLLLGGKETVGSFLEFKRRPGEQPSPGLSVLLFTLVLVLSFYGSLAMVKQGIPVMLTVVEYGFFLLPAVGIALLKGYGLKETFSLRPPGWSGALGAVLLGLSAWTVAGGLMVRLFPPPESFSKAMQKVILMEDQPVSTGLLFLLVAISPALCEEAFFRGIVMSGFRRLGQWPAIIATAFLFGLAHASIYRLLPTMALGVLMGYAVWRTRSIFAGMLVHMVNNGLIVAMAKFKPFNSMPGLRATDTYLPWSYIALGAVVTAIGIALIARGNREVRPESQPQSF